MSHEMDASTSGRDEERENSHALATVTARFTLHLHPSKAQDVMEGVREQLNMGLLRYSDDLGGVALAYSNPRITSGRGGGGGGSGGGNGGGGTSRVGARLHPYFPFLGVEAAADVSLFRPRPGQHLVGRVVKVGADYLALLVLGVFNAAIGAERIRKEFKCRLPGEAAWVSREDPTHRIEVGSRVRFLVEAVADHAGVVSVAGSLAERGTGLAGHVTVRVAAEAAMAAAAAAANKAGGKEGGAAATPKQQQQQANGHHNPKTPGSGKAADKQKKGGDKAGHGGSASGKNPKSGKKRAKGGEEQGHKKGGGGGGGDGSAQKHKHKDKKSKKH